METFSRGQQVVVLLLIFGMTLIFFHSINLPVYQPSDRPLMPRQAQHERDAAFVLSNQKVERPQGADINKASGPRLLTLNMQININTASVKDLEAISGIGPKTAERVADYRKKHGKFNKIEDIMKVPGIKEKKFEKIKRYLTVE